LFTQATNHSQHFCFKSKITCNYKQAKVTKSIKTIAALCGFHTLADNKLATSICTLAENKLFSGTIAKEVSAIGYILSYFSLLFVLSSLQVLGKHQGYVCTQVHMEDSYEHVDFFEDICGVLS
jgi:hypothetical protein